MKNRRKRTVGWQSRDIVRATALAMGLYFGAQLFWFAHPLFLTAFLGVLFGLAVSSGVDRLQRWRIPRGVGAPLIVVTFVGALIAFGAWMAPTLPNLRVQGIELQRKLPESIDRLDRWISAKQSGPLGMVMKGGRPTDPAPVAASDTRRATGQRAQPAPRSPAPRLDTTSRHFASASESRLAIDEVPVSGAVVDDRSRGWAADHHLHVDLHRRPTPVCIIAA